MADKHILLTNGTLLIHTPAPSASPATHNVTASPSDLLITNNLISVIAPHGQIPRPTTGTLQIIDCTNKLISPGFVDTHRHLWNTQLKGRHANEVLREYMFSGAGAGSHYQPEDVFWGQLSGCLESIDAGTTLVVDHSHIAYSEQHCDAALAATITSGIRSVFCYSPDSITIASWQPFTLSPDILPQWRIDQLKSYASKQPFGKGGRVKLGMGFDSYYLPAEIFTSVHKSARELGIKLITSHDVRGPITSNCIEKLHSNNMLNQHMLISHATNLSLGATNLLASSGAYTSSTAGTELSMQHGDPIAFHPDLHKKSSLGVDCGSSVSNFIPETMRVTLQYHRGKYMQSLLDQKKKAPTVNVSVLQAYNLGTIQGAVAAGLGDVTGSLEVGKLADIVIFDTLSPSMLCSVEQDPVAAIVIHSTVRDVEMVIIDGVVRKEAGKLLEVEVPEGQSGDSWERMYQITKERIGSRIRWEQVAMETLQSRKRIQERVDKVDLTEVKKMVLPFDDPQHTLVDEAA